MGKLTTEIFNESCCDGGECSPNDNSASPCGCDKGANWICQQHRKPEMHKSSGERLVQSESGDWYMIPVDKVLSWDKSGCMADNPPKWAIYVQSPDFVTLYEWSCGIDV